MISTNQFKNGMVIEVASGPFLIMEFQHVKPGKGGAFVRTKLKNLRSEAIVDKTFRAGEKFEQIIAERRQMQFLYRSDNNFVFMDNETYEQTEVEKSFVSAVAEYLSEGMQVTLLVLNNMPFAVELPNFLELRVVETVPGVKGDTVTGGTKPAKLETGKTINVPLFIEIDDVVKIDTRNNEYITRISGQ